MIGWQRWTAWRSRRRSLAASRSGGRERAGHRGLVTPWLIALLCAGSAQPAAATWSIVAVDADSGEVGSAGASCTPFVAGIVGLVPGRGVVVAQAMSNMEAKGKAAEMISDGAGARAVIAAISDRTFDASADEQQYGVALLGAHGPESHAFTGAATPLAHGHRLARGVAVQGNILVAETLLDATLAAYRHAEAQGRPLAERLLLALEAGARGGGDARCGGKTAQSAYLGVARPQDSPDRPTVRLIVATEREDQANPVTELRRRYDRTPKVERPARPRPDAR